MNLKKCEEELAKKEVKLKKQHGEMVDRSEDEQDKVPALKDAAETKVQSENRRQNEAARIRKISSKSWVARMLHQRHHSCFAICASPFVNITSGADV